MLQLPSNGFIHHNIYVKVRRGRGVENFAELRGRHFMNFEIIALE
jgi:hypothetical protein